MLTNKNKAAQAIGTLWTAFFLLFFNGCQPSGPKSLLLGDKYVRQGDYPKALKYLARAASLMPERPEVWNLQGLAYHGLQQPGRAAEAYQRALRIDRSFPPAHFNLGVLLLEQDRLGDAVTELNNYVALRPTDDQGWSRLGAALIRLRKADEADRVLTQALKLNPKNADAHNSLGLVHIQRKRPRDAVQSFNTALQYQPGFGAALLNQAVVAQQYFGNTQIALERYRAFLNCKPDPRLAAAVQLAIRQIEQPLAPAPAPVALSDLTTNTGIGLLLRSNLAQQADRARVLENSIRAATGSVAVTPALATNLPVAQVAKTNPPVLPSVSQPSFALKTNLPAVPTTQQVAQVLATNRAAPVPLPTANHALIAANSVKTNAVLTPPEEPEPAPLTVEVVAVNKEPEFQAPKDVDSGAAKATSSRSFEDKPLIAPRKRTDEEKRGLLARLKSANPAKWFEHDDTKTELRPVPVPLPPVRPLVFQETTNDSPTHLAPPRPQPRPIARYEYRKDLKLTKGNRSQALKPFSQATLAFQQGRLPEAVSLYRQAIALDPSYFEAHYNLGLAAYQEKDLPLALAANEEAVAINPSSVDARYNFALTLREGHYYADAASELRELLNQAPNEARAHLALANLYSQQLDEPALARSHYQQFLDLAPNHPEATFVRQWLVGSR